jgi:hypothetical protein
MNGDKEIHPRYMKKEELTGFGDCLKWEALT